MFLKILNLNQEIVYFHAYVINYQLSNQILVVKKSENFFSPQFHLIIVQFLVSFFPSPSSQKLIPVSFGLIYIWKDFVPYTLYVFIY